MAGIRRVIVYNEQIKAEFRLGGQAYADNKKTVDEIRYRATITAPARTRTLRRSHRSTVRGTNQYRSRGVVENTAEHAGWVHEGTRTPIRPKNFTRFKFPGNDGVVIFPREVRGQPSQPWLANAAYAVLSRK